MARINYPAGKKAKIVAFIRSRGRGGLVKANKKYGVSLPTLSVWVKQSLRRGRPRRVKPGRVAVAEKALKKISRLVKAIERAEGIIKKQEAVVTAKRKAIKALL